MQYVLSSRGATGNIFPAQGNGRRFVQRKRRFLMALDEVIERGITSGKYVQGPYVAALEKLIAKRWKVAAVVAVNSGSSALRLALEALQLEAGSEVLVPALTFISTAFAVNDAGLIPVFVDVDPQTLTMDPKSAQAAITEKTVALIPVHVHGQMADMSPCWTWQTPMAFLSWRMRHRPMARPTPAPFPPLLVMEPSLQAVWEM